MKSAALAVLLLPLTSLAASLDATIQRAQLVSLGMPVTGIVGRVDARAGQIVPKGTLLMALKPDSFEAAVEAAQADVTLKATRRAEAQRDYKQAKELYDRTVLSTVELENAKNNATRADAAWRHAQAVLKKTKVDLANSRIEAPFDAIVLKVDARAGEAIVSQIESRPLVTVAAAGEFLAVARAAPDRVTAFTVDKPATVTVAGKNYAGKVAAVTLDQLKGEAMYRVEVEFAAPEGTVAVGQSARIEVP